MKLDVDCVKNEVGWTSTFELNEYLQCFLQRVSVRKTDGKGGSQRGPVSDSLKPLVLQFRREAAIVHID